MRKSLLLTITIGTLLALLTGCRNKPPRIPMRPAGPDEVAPGESTSYQSVTTDPNRDKVLYIFDWGDNLSDTTGFVSSGDTVTLGHAWQDTGYYPIRVLAKDEKGNFSPDWSDTHLVHVMVPVNRQPDAPAKPTGPDSGWVEEWQVFSTSATDPDGDSVQILFLWDEGQTSLWSRFVPSGTTVTDSVKYHTRGLKSIRAIARDPDGLVSDTSEVKEFKALMVNIKPFPPALSGPARGIPNGPYYRFYARTTDPNPGDSVQYKFLWGDGTSSDWTALVPSGRQVMDSTRYSALGSYRIKVIARDQLGLVSDTSEALVFNVVGEGTILWGYAGGDEFVASPALGACSSAAELRPAVFIGGTDGSMYAIDAYQGERLYSTQSTSGEAFNSSPALDANNTPYIGCDDGVLYAFTPYGSIKWSYPDTFSDDDMAATPAIDGDFIYCGGENNYLIKLRNNGTEVWRYLLSDNILASPALTSTGDIIVCDDSGYVTALGSDGSFKWRYDTQGSIFASPAIGPGDVIYVATDQGKLFALSSSGTLLWTFTVPPPSNDINSSPVIDASGCIYFGCDNGNLYKLNPDSTLAWVANVSASPLTATPLLCADGIIYIPADNDTLYALNPDGSRRWAVWMGFPIGGKQSPRPRRLALSVTPSPVVDQFGIIYCASGRGIFAIAGRPEGVLMQSPWPMFHHDIRHTGKP
ncbi:MAG: PQQ-binding-like beta-propeller repeat protein [candidate division WOR-3 bacterium]